MKKFTSLALSLLCAVSTLWAQQTIKTSTADDPVYYVIASYNRGGYLTNAGVGAGVTHVALSDAAYWYFEEANEEGGVHFVNKLTGDNGEPIYLGSDKTASTTPATWYIITNGVNNLGMTICSATSVSGSNCIDANKGNTGVGGWAPSSNDWEGTTWIFVEESESESEEKYNPNNLIYPNRTDRYVTGVTLNSQNTTVNRDYTGNGLAYIDLTETVTMKAYAGETVTASIARNGHWVNAYVYIDKEGDGFTASIEGEYTPAEDLVSFSFYSGDEANDAQGYNSAGTALSGDSRNTIELPSFTMPTEPGTYRLRFKHDWNSIDPNGGNANFMSNGGSIIDVTLEVVADLPFKYAADYESIEHWYYVSIKNNSTYLQYTEGATAMTPNSVASDNRDAYSWAFVGDPATGFQIVNLAAGKDMILSSSTTMSGSSGGSTFPVLTELPVPEGNNTYWDFYFSTYRENGFYLEQKGYSGNKMNLRDGKLAYWSTGADGGSTFVVEYRDILGDAKNAVEAARNHYAVDETVEALIAAVESAIESSDYLAMSQTTKELITALSSMSIILPEPGKFYRVQNHSKTGYLVAGTGSGRTQFDDVVDNAANSIFYYTADSKFVSYTNGLYLVNNSSDSNRLSYAGTPGSENATTITFEASNTVGEVCLVFKDGTRNFYSAGLGNSDAGDKLATVIPSDANYYFNVTEVKELPIAIDTDFVWTTLYSPVQLGLTDKVVAYTGTLNQEDSSDLKLEITELEGSIPANTGVILALNHDEKSEENVENLLENGYIYLPIEESTIEGTSALTGTFEAFVPETSSDNETATADAAEETVESYLVFTKDTATAEDEEGNSYTYDFASFTLNNEDEIPAFSAYVKMSGVLADDVITIATSEGKNPTGIEEVVVEQNVNSGIYDLQGRRLSAPVKGINIINGKKVLVK